MTTIGILLTGIKNIVFNEYDERTKTVIRDFYANENCTVELPDSLDEDKTLHYTVIDSDGKSHPYIVSLGMLKEAA